MDKLVVVRDIFSAFVENCKLWYSMEKNVKIDEMLPGFRNKCEFRQYIPTKPTIYVTKILLWSIQKYFTQEILKYMPVSSQKILT